MSFLILWAAPWRRMVKIELDITDYGYSGEGVGKNQGKTCFVPYTLMGEKVLAEVISDKSKLCKCKSLKVLVPSQARLNPPCPYFGVCGGCSFQHTDYKTENDIKLQILKRQLAKVGFFGKIDVVLSPNEYNYRNKIKLFCKNNQLALFELSSKNLVPIKKCLLVNDEINYAIDKIQTFLSAKNIGRDLAQIVIKNQSGETLVWFDFLRKKEVDFSGLQIMLGAKAGIFTSIKGKNIVHQSGICSINQKFLQINCTFGPNSFAQVNDEVAKKLYQKINQLCSGQVVINAYSGAGLLSAILAKKHKIVYGIELGLAEHESAQKLKQDNNIENLFNIQGDCAQHIPKLIKKAQSLIVDPPRAGLSSSVCDAINKFGPAQLIYVSCNQATLVRDLANLQNYRLKKVVLYDMFAKTSSMEVLCALERKPQ